MDHVFVVLVDLTYENDQNDSFDTVTSLIGAFVSLEAAERAVKSDEESFRDIFIERKAVPEYAIYQVPLLA